MLTFEKYCQFIRQWQRDGYPFIVDDSLRQEIAVFDKILNDSADNGDAEAVKQRDSIEKLFAKPINITDFNLEEYLRGRFSQFNFSNKISNLYTQAIKGEKVEFAAPIERLGNYALMGNGVALNDDEKVKSKIQEIIDKILSVNKEPNKILRESLANHPIIFRYTKGELNACMSVCMIKHNLRPVLGVRIPNSDVLSNEDMIAGILGHELGHWLDFGYRPQKCVFENGVMQESFADIVGCQMAKNAGYDIEPFIDRVKGFIAYFNEHKLPQYEICAQKRFGLLTKIFKMPRSCNVELGKKERI